MTDIDGGGPDTGVGEDVDGGGPVLDATPYRICPWTVDLACLEEEWETDFDEPTKTRAIALASQTLWRLCAQRVGGCPKTVRPCNPTCYQPVRYDLTSWYGYSYIPMNWAGAWSNISCLCQGPCRHDPNVAVRLPAPVYSVTEVKVDGAVVDPADYWLSGNFLISLADAWPRTQNLDLPDTETGTFAVTYNDTAPVDGSGQYAAAKLALQYARACKSGACDLPESVTSLVRQGVTYDIPAGSFPNGETGLREVDAFIALWNPALPSGRRRRQRGRIYNL